MKKIVFPTLFSILFSFCAFAQHSLDLNNDTGCDLVYYVFEVNPNASCAPTQMHTVNVPNGTSATVSCPAGREFYRVEIVFSNEECSSEPIKLAYPNSHNCVTCQYMYHPEQEYLEVDCEEAECHGLNLIFQWRDGSNCNHSWIAAEPI